MDFTWLKTLAPTVATALGGPLAGIAVKAIGSAFGMSEPTMESVEKVLKQGMLAPEDLMRLQAAEFELQKIEKEQKFKFAELEAADRRSARDMQIQTRSPVPALLSIGVTMGYFGILGTMLAGMVKPEDSQALLLMLGSLSTAWGMVMSFWFGTTRSSEVKTDIIARAPAADVVPKR